MSKTKYKVSMFYNKPVTYISLVRYFQELFDMEYNGKPRILPSDIVLASIKHIEEELNEYMSAHIAKNKVAALDALCDLVYLLFGLVNYHGFQPMFPEAFRRVHVSNMMKVKKKGIGGHKRGIVKPEGWEKPELKSLLTKKGIY